MEFLDTYMLDNSLKNFLLVGGTILLVLLLKRYLSHYVASLLYMFVKNHWKTIEKTQFVSLIVKPLGWFLTVIITIFLLDKLVYPAAWEFSIYNLPFKTLIRRLAILVIIYSFTRLILSIVDFITLIIGVKTLATKQKTDDQILFFFRDFLKVVIVIVSILMILRSAFNQDLGRLLTGLSIVGAALALSAKESLENLIASFIIFFDKPFHVGDTLKVNAVTGTVEKIGLRSTRIRTPDRTLVTVPNKQMVDSVVDNHSMRNQRRAEIKLELDVKTTSQHVQEFLDDLKKIMAEKQDEIIKYSAFASDISRQGIMITLEYFTPPITTGEFNKLKQQVNLAIKKRIEEMQMNFATGTGAIQVNIPEGNNPPKSQPII